MKTNFVIAIVLAFFLSLSYSCKEDEKPVVKDSIPVINYVKPFPQAEGAGQYTTGGRAGKVIYVTNTNDSGTGSFREAVIQSGIRTVVFEVSGTIDLQSPIVIQNPYITIAGQTAPGDGICLKGFSTYIEADNVIIRFIRFRLGDFAGFTQTDPVSGNDVSNVLIDHCSMSWSIDECASFYDNSNFTMQWCLISESLRNSVHDKGNHGYGGIWGGQTATFHHNLLAHHSSRNPRFCGSRYTGRPDLEKVDHRNNVIYNWVYNSAYAAEGGTYNLVNNYYKPGPATYSGERSYRIIEPWETGSTAPDNDVQQSGSWGLFYVDGNYIDGNTTVTNDNWAGGIQPDGTVSEATIRSNIEFEMPTVTTHSAIDAYTYVLDYAGASLARDAVDARIVSEVTNGTYTYNGTNTFDSNDNPVPITFGIIDNQSDVGGWPTLNSLPAPVDTDRDGIPDVWEEANGLDKNNIVDGRSKSLDKDNNLTNLEIYLNSLVNHLYPN